MMMMMMEVDVMLMMSMSMTHANTTKIIIMNKIRHFNYTSNQYGTTDCY